MEKETLYKLTDSLGFTRNATMWGPGISHTAPGGDKLCTASWLHAYQHPLLAVFLDRAHGNFGKTARLWEAEGIVGLRKPDKVGCTELTTIREIPLPIVTRTQQIAFAILAAKDVFENQLWNRWADEWLSGLNRSAYAARAACVVAANAYVYAQAASAAYTASYAAACAAAWAAQAAYDADDNAVDDVIGDATAHAAVDAAAAHADLFAIAKRVVLEF